MQLSRRGFLGSLLAVVSAPAIVRVESLMALPAPARIIAPEPVLWVFDTSTKLWSSHNNLLSIRQITCEAVRLFKDSNTFIQAIDKQYDQEFAADQAQIGAQLFIRLPNEAFA